jgi:hypothetical protein
MSVRSQTRAKAARPKLSPATVAFELLRVRSELSRRASLAGEFRQRGFEDSSYEEITVQLRDSISTPVLEEALQGEEIHLPAPAVPYCIEVHRRIRRISEVRQHRPHLLHDETLILLASVSVQRALDALLRPEDLQRGSAGPD